MRQVKLNDVITGWHHTLHTEVDLLTGKVTGKVVSTVYDSTEAVVTRRSMGIIRHLYEEVNQWYW